jgi:hypothetical protein
MYTIANKLPSVEVLKERFEIDPSIPAGLKWKVNPGSGWVKAGDSAGRLTGTGYYQTGIKGSYYQNSRIIWKMINGKDPDQVIDHIDGNKRNNNISNLRDVTQRENSLNRKDFKSTNTNDRSFKTYFRNMWRALAS